MITLRTQTTRLIKSFVDFIYPPQCWLCHTRVLTHDTFCAPCWQQLHFIHPPFCTRCAQPLPYLVRGEAEQQCLACLAQQPRLTHTRAVWGYNAASSRLILAFKNHDASHLTPIFARFLEGVSRDVLQKTDVLIPVPLARRKLFSRFFNQSAELARALEKRTGIPMDTTSLKRVAALDQKTLGLAARKKNVKGVYFLKKGSSLKGKRIALIDDVYTTGATLEACADVLYAAGAADVSALVLARTLKS